MKSRSQSLAHCIQLDIFGAHVPLKFRSVRSVIMRRPRYFTMVILKRVLKIISFFLVFAFLFYLQIFFPHSEYKIVLIW